VLSHERICKKKGYAIIIGVDEAGRGPLAGPVVVAAVSLKTYRFPCRVDDSKKLSASQRRRAFDEIVAHSVFGIGVMNEGAVDQLNIARATNLAVDVAVMRLLKRCRRPRPTSKNTIILLDGRLRCSLPYASQEIIGGDGKSLSIAAASIIAKVYRDRLMEIFHQVYPDYGFDRHKGYGTDHHRRAIKRKGLSPIHRHSFCRSLTPRGRDEG
jgi:ribonuclease HII